MSKVSTNTYTCPKCGKEFEVSLYDSVNVTIDPELKTKVLDGSIFDFVCPDCGEENRVYYSMLYHDMDKHYMILFTATKSEVEEFQYMSNPSEMVPELKTAFSSQQYTMRGVLSHRDLISKIHVLDNGYDDRIVELMREEIIQHANAELQAEKKRGKVDCCIFVPNPETQGEILCAVFLKGQAKAAKIYELPHLLYKEYLTHFYDRLLHSRACLIDEEYWDKMKHADKISSANSYEQDIRTIYCAYDMQGIFHLCMERSPVIIPSVKLVIKGLNDDNDEPIQEEIKDGSYVFIEGENTRIKCKVVKHTRESWYTSQKEVDQSISKCVYGFKQVIELVNRTDRVNGLIINPNSDAVTIDYVSLNNFDSIKNW